MPVNIRAFLCCLLFLTSSMVESVKVNGLRRSWRQKDGIRKNLPIHNTMCSAATCKKCASVAKYTNRNDKKIWNYCIKIINLPKCCHRNLVVRSGDFIWRIWLVNQPVIKSTVAGIFCYYTVKLTLNTISYYLELFYLSIVEMVLNFSYITIKLITIYKMKIIKRLCRSFIDHFTL